MCDLELLIRLIYGLLVYCSTASKTHNAAAIPIVCNNEIFLEKTIKKRVCIW